jgi:transposase
VATPETGAELLPNDLAQCHALLNTKEALIEELTATVRLQAREKAALLHRIEQLLRQTYGRRSEKIDPAQLLLFAMEAMEAAAAPEAQAEAKAEAPSAPKKKGHGRKRPPLELPHLPLEHPVADADKVCAECGGEKKRIGEKITEQLEYAPASLFVIDHIQPVYACPCCQEGVVVAPKPAQPIEKGLPGPGLLAHVVVSKYGDHLPLYRQETIFERHGLELSRQTMCGWVMAGARLLEPLVDTMKRSILESKVIHTDDTPVTACTPGQKGTHKSRFWVYLGDGAHPYTVYDYTPSRKRDGPVAFLEGFFGTKEYPRYLQADAFGGYDGIYIRCDGNDPGRVLLEVACWAHARRKFYDARTSDVARSHALLGWIRELYQVERDAQELDAPKRRELRQENAKTILDKIKEWLDEQQGVVLPKSPIGEAIQYARNNWTALTRYLDDGDLAIDNNAAENALRAIAIGRKNWMTLGSDRGGRAAAILYSLVQSAKRHALDPFLYLRDLFLRILTHPNRQIDQLLPDHWKRDTLPTLDTPPRP